VKFDVIAISYRLRSNNRMSFRQKENARLVFVKRAQLYHASRLYLNSLYRRRSALDDELIRDLVELSLSPYTRVRRYRRIMRMYAVLVLTWLYRHCQTILQSVTGVSAITHEYRGDSLIYTFKSVLCSIYEVFFAYPV
jgi:hypothetical protein